MSNGVMCKCEIKDKKNWYVLTYHGNYSHFESPKGAFHYSRYSDVCCSKCGHTWRTKAKYVDELPQK
jgi:hypothetical protein